MDYVQSQIRRVSRNQMILFGILGAYFCVIPVSVLGSEGIEGLLGLVLFLSLIPASCIFFFIRACILRKHYQRSKIYTRLGTYGYGSSEEVSLAIDEELKNSVLINHKNLIVTSNWIVSAMPLIFMSGLWLS